MWKSAYNKIDTLDDKEVARDSSKADGSIVCLVNYFATGTKEIANAIGLYVWPGADTRFVTPGKSGSEYMIQEISTGK